MATEEQVIAAQRGDHEAFHHLISSKKEKLYSIAFAYLKDETDALEVIQETTYRAYTKLTKLKEPRYFHTWLIRILIRICIDEQKRKRKVMPLFQLPEHLAADLAMDDKILLEVAVDLLPPKLRHIIILKYYEDMTLSEIANLLEKPEGTVKTWLHKALNELRIALRKEGEHAQHV
ncbi:sigma-70 family RNA polymerase sigma factor [Paenibacillus planticolens]|uniref:Sigma-70 family RNA polymerase sigma factor n=1 Tax=Paenibacillus planticolens TaxID=2654976 RepID=A0ABX1ZEM1_9BACL|nr:sigma-70 family RNA polymerase sigma factor [Paenibacillus planticolens]NOU98553.1 sigma-70 family RNA polymerase sigma factor [Paenibacillus planticolens]